MRTPSSHNPHYSKQLIEKFTHIIHKILPCPCLFCGQESDLLICPVCTETFFNASSHRCITCGLTTLPNDIHCGNCLKSPPAFDYTVVVCDYMPPIDQLLLDLKFGNRIAIASILAQLLAQKIEAAYLPRPDIVIPTPLSPDRLIQRGFNQSLEIAKHLKQTLSVPFHPTLLIRTKDTQPQTELAYKLRQKNVAEAFALNITNRIDVTNQHIAVVDDVMTTGATLQSIASLLKKAGAKQITNWVFARTPLQ